MHIHNKDYLHNTKILTSKYTQKNKNVSVINQILWMPQALELLNSTR